jgi:hypothetical protein
MKGEDWFYDRIRVRKVANKKGDWYAIFDWNGKQIERKVNYTKDAYTYCVCSGWKVEVVLPDFTDLEQLSNVGNKATYKEIGYY